jgi:hypothetical protein
LFVCLCFCVAVCLCWCVAVFLLLCVCVAVCLCCCVSVWLCGCVSCVAVCLCCCVSVWLCVCFAVCLCDCVAVCLRCLLSAVTKVEQHFFTSFRIWIFCFSCTLKAWSKLHQNVSNKVPINTALNSKTLYWSAMKHSHRQRTKSVFL